MATGAVSSSMLLPSITCNSLRLVRDALGTATGVVFVGVELIDAAGRDALGAGTGVVVVVVVLCEAAARHA